MSCILEFVFVKLRLWGELLGEMIVGLLFLKGIVFSGLVMLKYLLWWWKGCMWEVLVKWEIVIFWIRVLLF